uniref:Retrotransposon hot spot (RHS) protein n=1 Tax=Panagrellus redivivus TaxID=6233 RepID=A0A7E4VWX4_PANRE
MPEQQNPSDFAPVTSGGPPWAVFFAEGWLVEGEGGLQPLPRPVTDAATPYFREGRSTRPASHFPVRTAPPVKPMMAVKKGMVDDDDVEASE